MQIVPLHRRRLRYRTGSGSDRMLSLDLASGVRPYDKLKTGSRAKLDPGPGRYRSQFCTDCLKVTRYPFLLNLVRCEI